MSRTPTVERSMEESDNVTDVTFHIFYFSLFFKLSDN